MLGVLGCFPSCLAACGGVAVRAPSPPVSMGGSSKLGSPGGTLQNKGAERLGGLTAAPIWSRVPTVSCPSTAGLGAACSESSGSEPLGIGGLGMAWGGSHHVHMCPQTGFGEAWGHPGAAMGAQGSLLAD